MTINLGHAKLQRTQHTFVHFYDLQPLKLQYENLNKQYLNLIHTINTDNTVTTDYENNNKIVEYIQSNINEKFNHFTTHSRTRRGIFNGLGTVVKSITGNLDAEDDKRYTEILKHLQENQSKLNNQIKHQYSVSHQMIEYFNKTVDTIRENENILKLKIEQLMHIVIAGDKNNNKLLIKDIYNQLNTLYTMTFNTLQDIENSLTFCKLHTLHPSIIKSHDLYKELNKISKFYNDELPFEINQENLLEIEKLISVNCKLQNNKIVYFIEIPINYETQFELIHLIPTPTKHNSDFVTIIPNSEYILKSEDGHLRSLYDVCTRNKENTYQCPSKIKEITEDSCEKNFILQNNVENCHFIKLNIKKNHIEYIEEINQYLAIFPNPEHLQAKCNQGDSISDIQGILLIKEDNCKLQIKNKNLLFKQGTFGKPLVIENFEINYNITKIPKMAIELNSINDLKPINKFDDTLYYNNDQIKAEDFNYPLCALYIIFIIGAIITAAVYFRKTFLKKKEEPKDEDIELQSRTSSPRSALKLPDEAQF